METSELIKLLRGKTKDQTSVAYKQSICWFLYSQHNISCHIIANVLKCKRRQVYRRMYACRDLIEVNDKIETAAYNELSAHKILIKPAFVDDEIISRFCGYRLLIDNQIF